MTIDTLNSIKHIVELVGYRTCQQ